MEALLSLGLGGILRLAPEILDFFDRKNKRAHEVTMAEKNLVTSAVQTEGAAMGEALRAQGIITGVRWADALNVSVRPVLTYWWCVILYTVAMGAAFTSLLDSGMPVLKAIEAVFGAPEKDMVRTMLSFWFVDRAAKYIKAGTK